jgi:DNA-binding CsgD family transcriptional regulator
VTETAAALAAKLDALERQRLAEAARDRLRPWQPGPPPTPRQLESLALVLALGQRNAARAMGVSAMTVKRHLENLYTRTGAGSAIEAAAMVGWLDVPDDVWADIMSGVDAPPHSRLGAGGRNGAGGAAGADHAARTRQAGA